MHTSTWQAFLSRYNGRGQKMINKKGKKTKKKEKIEKNETKDYATEILQMQNSIKTFIKNFKSDVVKKKKDYTAYIQNLKNKQR